MGFLGLSDHSCWPFCLLVDDYELKEDNPSLSQSRSLIHCVWQREGHCCRPVTRLIMQPLSAALCLESFVRKKSRVLKKESKRKTSVYGKERGDYFCTSSFIPQHWQKKERKRQCKKSATIRGTLLIEIDSSWIVTILEWSSDSTFTTGRRCTKRKRMLKHRCAYKTCHDSFGTWQTVSGVWLNLYYSHSEAVFTLCWISWAKTEFEANLIVD